jgi:ribosomal protein S21
MIQVTKKDKSESTESLVRRFNRKMLQSGVILQVKAAQRFEKALSKPERRKKAIVRAARRSDKVKRMKLGLK